MSQRWPQIRRDSLAAYVIRVRGAPGAKLTREAWDVRVEHQPDGTTVLSAEFADQPDLLGFLRALVGAGCEIISVECLG
jgi:hypothetical protein